ncbi:LysR family transcriptional regulator [Acidocella aminolytica]|uniref:Transcriptional regulator LysR n=1 Tax=Acidocella aminolytica 101 = DSM 11237 TaxID=1120923 RepID=A0A0D6PJY1_9PROT|nr:LysR family transcriptional regulator [Acidocella aminolytica]GAN81513.1 transcriptional regulator LysR [Acidocella aminolytica 101 = DSM 11237]GBQ33074.1 transcriptional regulator [Acidocella aminolytica 101 = DSM 11237]SHF56573.1 DNA-binding transcriptional regulator, LysR family [Acidocella aminolytica 101 = DSM 11237]
MNKADLRDTYTLAIIAEECSFTRASAKLGVSTSALSHQIRDFERRLGVQLLHRSTRSVSLTEAGASLLARAGPGLAEVAAGLGLLGEWRSTPAGTVRITANRWSVERYIEPVLSRLHCDYPAVVVELSVDESLIDIVRDGFDLGIRPGRLIAPDMVVHRLEPDDRSAVVASPEYIAKHRTPEAPEDLSAHRCMFYRIAGSRDLQLWKMHRNGLTTRMVLEPAFVTDDADLLIRRAIAGDGLAYVRHRRAREHLKSGALVEVLEPWSAPLAGNHLYHASRRVLSPAIRLVMALLKEGVPKIQAPV